MNWAINKRWKPLAKVKEAYTEGASEGRLGDLIGPIIPKNGGMAGQPLRSG